VQSHAKQPKQTAYTTVTNAKITHSQKITNCFRQFN